MLGCVAPWLGAMQNGYVGVAVFAWLAAYWLVSLVGNSWPTGWRAAGLSDWPLANLKSCLPGRDRNRPIFPILSKPPAQP